MLLVEAGRVTLLVEASGYFSLTTTLEIPEAGLSGAELALARETPFATSVAVTASAPSAAPVTEVVPPVQVLRDTRRARQRLSDVTYPSRCGGDRGL